MRKLAFYAAAASSAVFCGLFGLHAYLDAYITHALSIG
jgi:hypothetical protein